MLFRNEENKAGYVLEYIDKITLIKSLEPGPKFGKYDHFEAMKPNKDYLQRRSSGPYITFSHSLSNLFHYQPHEQFGNIHEPLYNVPEPGSPPPDETGNPWTDPWNSPGRPEFVGEF